MNKTEALARDWLIASYGYLPENITFRSHESPDFIVRGGMAVEVKKLKCKTLHIPETQWLDLKRCPNCFIAIFDCVCSVPKVLIPVKELDPPAIWGEYNILVAPDGGAKWKAHLQKVAELSGRDLTTGQRSYTIADKQKRNASLIQYRSEHPNVTLRELARIYHISHQMVWKIISS